MTEKAGSLAAAAGRAAATRDRAHTLSDAPAARNRRGDIDSALAGAPVPTVDFRPSIPGRDAEVDTPTRKESQMHRNTLYAAVLAPCLAIPALAAPPSATTPGWSMNATIIEACSCPMFCSCYFGSGHPSGHHNMESHAEEHFCRFNNAFRVNKGQYNGVKLDGAKFWVAGDLGGDFSKGQMDWAVLTFDKAMTKEQRDGIAAIVGHLYPVQWNSLTTAEGEMSWEAGPTQSRALLDGGRTAEVALAKGGFGEGGQTPVIKGLQYWAANHNDGFVLMPNTVETYHAGPKPFEFKGTNGFMITVDIHGSAEKPGAKGGM
jgi:hypothetical protein